MEPADTAVHVDDEVLALRLQLEEIEAQRELQSGKWTEGSPPDVVLAFDDFEAELKKAIRLEQDWKLAHSIAKAVDTDVAAIDEAAAEETQSVRDRQLALTLNEGENLPEQAPVELPANPPSRSSWIDWAYVPRAIEASTSSHRSLTTVAGPSVPYALRQKEALEDLPQLKVVCSVCGDSVHPQVTVRLGCSDIYCKPCLKGFLMRATRDESLFPPRCHRQPIDISIIEADFTAEELAIYRSAEQEFTDENRVYCANTACSKFIPNIRRTPDAASCEACGADTCIHCTALAHHGKACPEDVEGQALIKFANAQGWQACYGCGRVLLRYEGCDHMTCRCGAQFCYRCGVKWKQCECSDWAPELLRQRAEQVVDREAPALLAPAARQRRVETMAQELRQNHQCEHRGRFRRLEGSRRGHVCEICGDRHRKYILSCKRCHMLACEECRRYRI